MLTKYAHELVVGDKFLLRHLEKFYHASVIRNVEKNEDGQLVVPCSVNGSEGQKFFATGDIVNLV
jgi:hypothetical protein